MAARPSGKIDAAARSAHSRRPMAIGSNKRTARAMAAGMETRSLRERLGALSNLPPFLRQVWAISPTFTLLAAFLRLGRAILPVAMLYVAKLIIDETVRLIGLGHGAGDLLAQYHAGVVDHLLFLLLLECTLAVLSDVIGRAISLVDSLLTDLFNNVMSVRLMEHAASLDLEDFEDSEVQDKLDRARRITMSGVPLLSQLLGRVQDLITIVAFAAGLIAYAPWLILVLIIAVTPSFIGEAHFNALNYLLNYSWTPERRELEYVRHTGASVETAKEVKIFGLNDFLITRYRKLADDFYRAGRRIAVNRALWGSLFAAIGTLGYYLAYGYIALRAVRGDFTIGDLTFLAGSFLRLRGLLDGLLTGFSMIAGQALYLDDLFSFFEIRPEIDSKPGAPALPKPIRDGFVFENVGFRYPGAERWAVRRLNFSLKAGEALALVGENGAGKTTLVKLLARLYDPDEGRILLDGVDLRDYDLNSLRSNVGVIFQDFVRYHMTAGENIAVGRIEERGDRARVEEAARRSMADRVIEKLPDQYDQMIGRRFLSGVDLSGGEWQKIAIARAYMRDAQVLILDEPTAALDARAEFEVFQRFKELSAGKTAVLISHRFSSVRMADRILVLNEGEIEAAGSHEELLRQKGRYAELFELQAAGYR